MKKIEINYMLRYFFRKILGAKVLHLNHSFKILFQIIKLKYLYLITHTILKKHFI